MSIPRTNQTGKNEWADVESNDLYLEEQILATKAEVAAVSGITWYAPKVIATEQTITTTTYKLMSENGAGGTADEVASVVMPEDGLIMVGYRATWKGSSSGAPRASLFLGNNQIKMSGSNQAASALSGTEFQRLSSYHAGLEGGNELGAGVTTTGEILGTVGSSVAVGGMTPIYAAAGTYSVSVRFQANTGSITAKNRKLWVAVLG